MQTVGDSLHEMSNHVFWEKKKRKKKKKKKKYNKKNHIVVCWICPERGKVKLEIIS